MKTVMLLGGTKGVGNEILKSCLKKGYNVAFCGRDENLGNQIIESSECKDNLYFHKIDLNSINGIEDYYNQTSEL